MPRELRGDRFREPLVPQLAVRGAAGTVAPLRGGSISLGPGDRTQRSDRRRRGRVCARSRSTARTPPRPGRAPRRGRPSRSGVGLRYRGTTPAPSDCRCSGRAPTQSAKAIHHSLPLLRKTASASSSRGRASSNLPCMYRVIARLQRVRAASCPGRDLPRSHSARLSSSSASATSQRPCIHATWPACERSARPVLRRSPRALSARSSQCRASWKALRRQNQLSATTSRTTARSGATAEAVGERGAEVLPFDLEPRQPLRLLGAEELRLGRFGERQVRVEVPVRRGLRCPPPRRELLRGVLADELVQREAAATIDPQQRLPTSDRRSPYDAPATACASGAAKPPRKTDRRMNTAWASGSATSRRSRRRPACSGVAPAGRARPPSGSRARLAPLARSSRSS
jgi:hypothetical protein